MHSLPDDRIGQRSVASSATRLLFTTAGLLLEDLRVNGAAALAGCKCVVFDEVSLTFPGAFPSLACRSASVERERKREREA